MQAQFQCYIIFRCLAVPLWLPGNPSPKIFDLDPSWCSHLPDRHREILGELIASRRAAEYQCQSWWKVLHAASAIGHTDEANLLVKGELICLSSRQHHSHGIRKPSSTDCTDPVRTCLVKAHFPRTLDFKYFRICSMNSVFIIAQYIHFHLK